jgi:hypothetical protein
MSRYSKFPQGMDEKMPLPPSIKNDIVFTPNHENLHANSSKQPFSLVVDSRDRNIELYPNPNNYVIQVPRYKDVLSVELIGADIPHSGFNIDSTCNTLYIAFTQEMFINYYNGVRQNGDSYIEVTIPPGYYEASDLVSNTGLIGTLNYENYYNSGPVSYIANTGILATALKLAVSGTPYAAADFYVVFNYKTLKYVIISDWAFAILNRETDKNTSNQPIPNFYVNQNVNVYTSPVTYYNIPPTSAQANDSYLGANNDRFISLPRCIYNVLGFDLKNYFPAGNLYSYETAPIGGGNTLVDGAYNPNNVNYVQISKGENYYWPPPYTVNYNTAYDPANPCDANLTGLPITAGPLGGTNFVAYSLPNIVNMVGEKYLILDIPELNYRDITNSINNQFYCRILLDTSQNTIPLSNYYNTTDQYPTITNLSTNNTVKAIKSSDIGNNRCIKYFSPSQGVLAKLTIRWLKYDGTPYDFQGQDHTLGFEIITIKQTGTYYN